MYVDGLSTVFTVEIKIGVKTISFHKLQEFKTNILQFICSYLQSHEKD